MKAKTTPDQFQLIPEAEMPFNLAGETLPPQPPHDQTKTQTIYGTDLYGNPVTREITWGTLHPNQPNCWPR